MSEDVDFDQATLVRKAARKAAERLDVNIEFAEGKRESDLSFVTVRGDKKGVSDFLMQLSERLPDTDIELINHDVQRLLHTLTLVVTEKLQYQTIHSEERRAKLLSFARYDLD